MGTISVDDLHDRGACDEHADLFEKLFGDGPVKPTLKNVQRAAKKGLNLDWFLRHFGTSHWEPKSN